MKRVLALFCVLVLLAVACSDDDGDTSVGTDETSSEGEATDDEASETEEPDEQDVAGAESGAPADEEAVEDVALFDSFQGVTAEQIDFGVAAIDAEALLAFGFDLGVAPVEQMYEAWSAAQNERGGVLGRQLVPHTELFLPIGATESEAVCVKFAEDIGLFATIGQFLQDNPLCLTEQYGLPYIGHFGLTDQMDERSEGRFIATEMSPTDQRYGGVAAMIEQGDLDGKKVALWWDNPVDAQFADLVRPLLDEAGVEITVEIEVGDFGQDTAAADAAEDPNMQRVIAEGTDVILVLGGIVPVTEAADRNFYEGEIAFTNGQAADQFVFPEAVLNNDPDLGERTFAITTAKPTPEEALADPGVSQCLDEYDAAFPDDPVNLESKETVQQLVNHCRAFALMVMVFEQAGADLNPESFTAAAESLGSFSLPAMSGAYLGPDSRSAGSQIQRYEYDASVGYHLPEGEPFDGETAP